jgi:ABC-type lipopolysaccharide export system ATPase subunit
LASTRGFDIETGRIVAADKTSTFAASADIRRAYLGEVFDLAS